MASDKEDMVLASSRSSQGKVESKDQSSTGSSNANVNDTTDSGIDEQGHDFLSMSDEGTDLDKHLERLDVSSSEDDDTTSLEYVTATAVSRL